MKKQLLSLLTFLTVCVAYGQQDTLFTRPPLTGGVSTSTGSGISFNLTAKSASINLLEVACQTSTATNGYEIWYNTDSVNGPPNICAANGWVMHETGTITGIATTMNYIVLTDPLNIPAGETYGIFFRLLGSSVQYTSGASPTIFQTNDLKINVGSLAGYVGNWS